MTGSSPSPYSDYIIYVDESGDHSLTSIDPQYPIFVLAICIFSKQDYSRLIVPAVQDFKFEFFGHDMVVLHEMDIRKTRGPFTLLVEVDVRSRFMTALNDLIAAASFTIISTVIRKERLRQQYAAPDNPYHLALTFCLERAHRYLFDLGQGRRITHVVFECRGKKEDAQLELEFRRICDGANYAREQFPFKIIMADKKVNSVGLQRADMVARPIGLHVLRPGQSNRAYDILEAKIHRSATGAVLGYGLKCFP